MFFHETLSPATRELLEKLSKKKWLKKFYLAGGTTAALHFGHRISEDLDFFTNQKFSLSTLKQELKKIALLKIDSEGWQTIVGRLAGVKISFFFWDYPLLKSPLKYHDVSLLDPVDLGFMKLDAIASRGTKRDFIDLYIICQKSISLFELFLLIPKKFPGVEYNYYHLLKSLTYFADADKDEMPRMLKKIHWPDVKTFFRVEAAKIIKKLGIF